MRKLFFETKPSSVCTSSSSSLRNSVDAQLHKVLVHPGQFDAWAAWRWTISKCQLMLTTLVSSMFEAMLHLPLRLYVQQPYLADN